MGHVTTAEHEGYVEYSFHGTFDHDGVIKAFHNIWAANDYELNRNKLFDLTNSDFKLPTSATTDDVLNLRRSVNEGTTRFPIAVLANDDLIFGLSRMVAAQSSEELNPNIKVFRDRQEAVDWVTTE